MSGKNGTALSGKARVAISCLVALMLIVLSACEKEKVQKPLRITGPCQVYDKLPAGIATPVEINYGNKIKLLGITAEKQPLNKLKISYYWQLMDDLGSFNTVFVHFTDKDDKELFGNDHDFCQDKPFKELKGKFIEEPFVIDIAPAAIGKEIMIKIGMYSMESTGRMKIESSGGIPSDNDKTRAIVEKVKL